MQQERFVPTNNNMIPFQIINKQPTCNNWNGEIDMLNYGLTPSFKNNLIRSWNTVGLLANVEKESPFYNPPSIDKKYANFLLQTQQCKIIDNTTFPKN